MTDTKTKDEAKAPEKRIIKARSGDLSAPNSDSRIWTLTMREGVTFEDVMKPAFWTSLADKFSVGTQFHNRVSVVNEEHSFFAELYVRSVQENQVIVEPIVGPHYFDTVEVSEDATLVPKWNLGKRSFEAVRSADNKPVQGGFATKEQCVEWIDDHLNKVAA